MSTSVLVTKEYLTSKGCCKGGMELAGSLAKFPWTISTDPEQNLKLVFKLMSGGFDQWHALLDKFTSRYAKGADHDDTSVFLSRGAPAIDDDALYASQIMAHTAACIIEEDTGSLPEDI